jgi:streptogramin lyase
MMIHWKDVSALVVVAFLCCGATPTPTPTPAPAFVPPDKSIARCEVEVSKNVSKLRQCIELSHTEAVRATVFGSGFFDEQAFTGPESCRARYDAIQATVLTSGTCPVCLDGAHQASLAEQTEAEMDGRNGAFYCAGSSGILTSPIESFDIPTPHNNPFAITAGPDGNVWFTEAGGSGQDKVGRITPTGVITEFATPTGNSGPGGITAGPDGNVWFAETDAVARITPTGTITEYPIAFNSGIGNIATGADGNLWFTESNRQQLGRITPAGVLTEFAIPEPSYIAAGSDGNIWFADVDGIGRFTPSGVLTNFPWANKPAFLTVGPDGNLWFSEQAGPPPAIGRVTPSGVFTEFPIRESAQQGIAAGADGNLWFSEGFGNIGRMTPDGATMEFVFPPGANIQATSRMTAGPDGNIWFTDATANQIHRLNPGVEAGFLPPDQASLSCEGRAAKNLTKFEDCIDKCHRTEADRAASQAAYDQTACKNSCRGKYDTKVANLRAAGGCPLCLNDSAQAALADEVQVELDERNGGFYCAGAVPLEP